MGWSDYEGWNFCERLEQGTQWEEGTLELIRIILAVKVEGHRMIRMSHLYGFEDQTVCEPKACRIQYKTVTIVETKESTAVLKAGT